MQKTKIDRTTAAVELLVEACRLVESRGSLPAAVTLARAGAQAFSDRVQRTGDTSALWEIAKLTEKAFGPAFGWKWLQGQVLTPSNALKHGQDAAEAETVELFYELAVLLIFAGCCDCEKLVGSVDPHLMAFRDRQMPNIHGWMTPRPSIEPTLTGRKSRRTWLLGESDEPRKREGRRRQSPRREDGPRLGAVLPLALAAHRVGVHAMGGA